MPIPRFLATELAEHVRGKRLDDLVFAGIRNGQPLRVATFRTAFSTASRAIGVPDLHPHQLRHTAASLAIASGADVKVVQQMLGHSSATMTLDTYGHLFEDASTTSATPWTPPARQPGHAAGGQIRCPVLPQCCPSPIPRQMPKGPGAAFPLVRTPFRTRTPDRIRTGATALRGRRARPLHNGGLN